MTDDAEQPQPAGRAPGRAARRRSLLGLGFAAVALLAIGAGLMAVGPGRDILPASTPSPSATPSPTLTWQPLVATEPTDGISPLTGDDKATLAAAAAEHFVESAPLAVFAPRDDGPAERLAAWLALRLHAPLLFEPQAVPPRPSVPAVAPSASPSASPTPDPAQLAAAHLGIRTAIAVGTAAPPPTIGDVQRVRLNPSAASSTAPGTSVAAPPGLPAPGPSATASPTPAPSPGPALEDLPWRERLEALAVRTEPPVPADLSAVEGLLHAASVAAPHEGDRLPVLVRPDDAATFGAAVTALAAGRDLVPMAGDDPRGDPDLHEPLADTAEGTVVLLGSSGTWEGVSPDTLAWQLAVARAGRQLPGGGQLLFPDRRLVALYGTPGSGALGVLGEQPVDAAIERAKAVAADYEPRSSEPVIPTFEIIATIASASAGDDGDYSSEVDLSAIEEWVDAAEREGVYVVLDLQPGRTDFLTQAKRLEPLLRRPHVGLALDPEWRLKPGQVHLRQIGSVEIDEVNRVAAWLADLTRRHALPQKLLLLHQFRLSMLPNRESLRVPAELAVAIQMDGQGPQGVKLETWRVLTRSSPPADVWWGWKNFYDEDSPTRSAADTMALDPRPYYVSYQ